MSLPHLQDRVADPELRVVDDAVGRLRAIAFFPAECPPDEVDQPGRVASLHVGRQAAEALGGEPRRAVCGEIPGIPGRVLHARLAIPVSLIHGSVERRRARLEGARIGRIRVLDVEVHRRGERRKRGRAVRDLHDRISDADLRMADRAAFSGHTKQLLGAERPRQEGDQAGRARSLEVRRDGVESLAQSSRGDLRVPASALELGPELFAESVLREPEEIHGDGRERVELRIPRRGRLSSRGEHPRDDFVEPFDPVLLSHGIHPCAPATSPGRGIEAV